MGRRRFLTAREQHEMLSPWRGTLPKMAADDQDDEDFKWDDAHDFDRDPDEYGHCPDCNAPYLKEDGQEGFDKADHDSVNCDFGRKRKQDGIKEKNRKAFDPALDRPSPVGPATIRGLAAEYGMTPKELQHYSDMRDAHPDEPLTNENEEFLRDLVENSVDGVYQRDPNWNPDDYPDPFDPRTFGASRDGD